jgi:hypothetical protein
MDKSFICEYSGLPSVQSYEPTGVGGESIKENFIDSNVSQSAPTSGSVDGSIDYMYNWIRKHSGK